jgi:hypothetical protein
MFIGFAWPSTLKLSIIHPFCTPNSYGTSRPKPDESRKNRSNLVHIIITMQELQTRAFRKLEQLYAPVSRIEATKSASNTLNRSRKPKNVHPRPLLKRTT